jgi:serine/threonine-protein phosphatase 2B catalytic subunit
VKAPVMTIPTDDEFFSKTEAGKPDVEFLKDHFFRQGRIKEEHALYIIDKATQLMRVERNVLTLVSTVNVPRAVTGAHTIRQSLLYLFGF